MGRPARTVEYQLDPIEDLDLEHEVRILEEWWASNEANLKTPYTALTPIPRSKCKTASRSLTQTEIEGLCYPPKEEFHPSNQGTYGDPL